jgi:hypothetical protein
MGEQAEAIWNLLDETTTARVIRISMASPLEIVLVAPLMTAATVNGFAILVEAIRRLSAAPRSSRE